MKRWMLLGGIVLVVLVGGLFAYNQWFKKPVTLPDVIVTGTNGSPYKLKGYLGDTLFVVIGKSTCSGCVDTMKSVRDFAATNSDVQFLIVDRKESVETVTKMVADNKLEDLTVVIDDTDKIFKSVAWIRMPQILAVNADGVVIDQRTEVMTVDELKSFVEKNSK